MLLTLLYSTGASAQTKVQVGDLYYELSGISASVARYTTYGGASLYTKDTYVIPESITYNSFNYKVNKIDSWAFSCPSDGYPDYGSSANRIILPNTIEQIGVCAFRYCKNLTSMIIPESVVLFERSGGLWDGPFNCCYLLREIIYLSSTAPQNWTATTYTYVPDKQAYSSPQYTINDAHIIEMISFSEDEFYYTGQAPTITWTNNVEGYTASLTIPPLKADVGNYEELIPVTFTKGNESFTANVVYRYTIKPTKLTAKVANTNREYGEENPQFSISYSGFIGSDNENVLITRPIASTTAVKTSNVGEYPITISGGYAVNYELEYEPGVLTVAKAPLSAKVNDATKVYGSQNPIFSIEYYGLKNDETSPVWSSRPSFQTEATENSNVGQYVVNAVNGVPLNYDMSEITAGTLNVTPASLTIKANDAVRQYYSEEPIFSYKCTGFMNGDNESALSPLPTLSTSATLESNVGTYEIKISETSNPNYSISYLSGTLTITPRTLIASVGNYERAYNEENPLFEIKYDGFVGADNDVVLNEKPTANTTATKISDVGTYPINIVGGNAENYQFSYTSGTLTINKAEQTLVWEQDLTELGVGDQVELKAIASSGLPITYSIENNNAAEIYTAGVKTYLDCKAEGQFYIRAVQEGNKNYYSSPRASKFVTIGESNSSTDPVYSVKDSSAKIQSTPFGIRVTDAVIGDLIRVFSVDGILQKSIKVEEGIVDIPLSSANVYIVKVGSKTMKVGL